MENKNLHIKNFVVGELETNCYIIWDEKYIDEAVIIDPGAEPKILLDFIKMKNLEIKYIINTHGHADHIAANNYIKDAFLNAKILINEKDNDSLTDPDKNLSSWFSSKVITYKADDFLKEGDILKFGNENEFKIIETPGHKIGSICLLLNDKYLFSGDTLFAGSIGRTDFPDSSLKDMNISLKKLMLLNKNIIVYPGHGLATTIKDELSKNPWLDDNEINRRI
jgi:glyoxylase-like metal-dependent hydrolase (beta-lactamase superfamily II)